MDFRATAVRLLFGILNDSSHLIGVIAVFFATLERFITGDLRETRVCTTIEKQLHDLGVSIVDCVDEGRVAILVSPIYNRSIIYQELDCLDESIKRCNL